MSTRGVDVRQSTDRIVFRASLKDGSGAKVTSGTTELRLYELQDDGTLKVYDWTTHLFVATGAGTPDDETTMTQRQRRDSGGTDVDTGIWTIVLTTLTGLTVGNIYITQVTNSLAVPETQEREFQFGDVEGSQACDTDAKAAAAAAALGRVDYDYSTKRKKVYAADKTTLLAEREVQSISGGQGVREEPV